MVAKERDKPAERSDDARADALARILAAVRAIPRGRVASYGQVAANAGLKGRARLVGYALRTGDGRALPWHRVLRANGASAFPDGSAGRAEQCKRLEREGVRVARGRVDLGRYCWTRDLDVLLWGPRAGAPDVPRRRSRRAAAPARRRA
jgi:methylated-DNA-protein-cysteine methyltransferase-like protein